MLRASGILAVMVLTLGLLIPSASASQSSFCDGHQADVEKVLQEQGPAAAIDALTDQHYSQYIDGKWYCGGVEFAINQGGEWVVTGHVGLPDMPWWWDLIDFFLP
jgi:hypothetical protein